jgi:hypothetical protein
MRKGAAANRFYYPLNRKGEKTARKKPWPVSERTNVYGGLGGGYSWSRINIEGSGLFPAIITKRRGYQYDGLLGGAYFLTTHVALDLQVDVARKIYRQYGYNSRSTNTSTQLGLSLYF